MTIRMLIFGTLLPALGCISPCASAQVVHKRPATISNSQNAAWVRASAASGNFIITNSRFHPLLQSSFRQKQWFWYDHSKFTPLPDVIYSFLATSSIRGGDTILEQDRYVTINGCFGGVCNAIKGMLWIDTRATPAVLIFAGTQFVDTAEHEPSKSSLWVFSSTKLDWTRLPQPFLMSVHRWLSAFQNYTWQDDGNRFSFVVATLVQPSGETIELTPSVLNVPESEIATK